MHFLYAAVDYDLFASTVASCTTTHCGKIPIFVLKIHSQWNLLQHWKRIFIFHPTKMKLFFLNTKLYSSTVCDTTVAFFLLPLLLLAILYLWEERSSKIDRDRIIIVVLHMQTSFHDDFSKLEFFQTSLHIGNLDTFLHACA